MTPPATPAVPVLDEATTRDRVAHSILEHGPSTAAELAQRLGLTTAAVRRHLTALVERGEISSREQRVYGQRGRGRPSKVFYLTDQGHGEFYQAYDDLAIAAMTQLANTAGSTAVHSLAEQRVETLEAAYRELAEQYPDRPAVELLAEALSADGYAASIRPAMAGDQLCQHHCPVAAVAAEFPQLCEAETQLFSRLLDSHVQRLATIAHGDGVCTTHVPRMIVAGENPLHPPAADPKTPLPSSPTERSQP
nr:metalloregulator ArsR/SmtB family transcription factor [Aestuariimicrobium ganziense]